MKPKRKVLRNNVDKKNLGLFTSNYIMALTINGEKVNTEPFKYYKPLKNIFVDSEGNLRDPEVPRARGSILLPEVTAAYPDLKDMAGRYNIASNDAIAVANGRPVNMHLRKAIDEGAAKQAAWAQEHPYFNMAGIAAGAAPLVVATTPAVVGGGELAVTALANPYVDAGITSAFAGHGLNHAINEGIDGWGDAAMTALELTPLGRLAKPIYNASSKLGADVVDKVKWLYNEGNVFNAPMKYNPENFYRLVGKDAIEDANLTGVIRANPNSNFKVPYFGYKRGNPSTSVSNYDNRLIIEGSPNSAETWADSWRYDSRRDFIKNNLDNLTSELKTAESPEMVGLYTDEEIQALHKQRAFWNDLFKNKYRDVRETPTTRPLSTQYFEEVSKNRPGWMMEFGNEAFPSNAGSASVPNDNFIYWQKYPLLGWRPNSFKTASGSRSALPRVPISTPQITAENAASITPEQWTAAQDVAIARGDMAEAQRLRDLHFKAKAPEADVPDQFHGTHYDDLGNQILLNKGVEQGTNGVGFYTSSNKPYARKYGSNIFKFKVNAKTEDLAQGRFAYLSENKMNELKARGYKGTIDATSGPMLGAGRDAVEYTFFDPSIYKSADAVTFDPVTGKRIPLGDRDNFNINDIRYGLLPFLGLGAAGALYRN